MTTLEKIRTEIEHWESDDTQDEYQIGAMDMQNYVLRVIDKYAEQEPKTGHWITEDMFDGDVAYRCSECNELFWIESGTPKDNEYNYCPKCGKRLVEPRESEVKNG